MARKPSKVLTAAQAKKKDKILENKDTMKDIRLELKDAKAAARASMKEAKADEKKVATLTKQLDRLKAQNEKLDAQING